MITIYDHNGHFIPYDSLTFSGGEEHIRLKWNGSTKASVRIEARLWAGREVLQLLMITDALRRHGFGEIDLVMPYVPYARQDRVCNLGEALSIKVFCDLINAQGYRNVEIWDAHSDVTPALLHRCKNVEQWEFATFDPVLSCVVVAPDAGAEKKAGKVADKLGCYQLNFSKIRDVSTGAVTGVQMNNWSAHFRNFTKYIVDDICDGGRTFIEVAKKLKEKDPDKKVYLYVTHGIFSKGLEALKPYIDHVYTANIFPDRYQGNEDYVTVLRRP